MPASKHANASCGEVSCENHLLAPAVLRFPGCPPRNSARMGCVCAHPRRLQDNVSTIDLLNLRVWDELQTLLCVSSSDEDSKSKRRKRKGPGRRQCLATQTKADIYAKFSPISPLEFPSHVTQDRYKRRHVALRFLL